MNLYNIKHPEEQVNFAQAVRQGLGEESRFVLSRNNPRFNQY